MAGKGTSGSGHSKPETQTRTHCGLITWLGPWATDTAPHLSQMVNGQVHVTKGWECQVASEARTSSKILFSSQKKQRCRTDASSQHSKEASVPFGLTNSPSHSGTPARLGWSHHLWPTGFTTWHLAGKYEISLLVNMKTEFGEKGKRWEKHESLLEKQQSWINNNLRMHSCKKVEGICGFCVCKISTCFNTKHSVTFAMEMSPLATQSSQPHNLCVKV